MYMYHFSQQFLDFLEPFLVDKIGETSQCIKSIPVKCVYCIDKKVLKQVMYDNKLTGCSVYGLGTVYECQKLYTLLDIDDNYGLIYYDNTRFTKDKCVAIGNIWIIIITDTYVSLDLLRRIVVSKNTNYDVYEQCVNNLEVATVIISVDNLEDYLDSFINTSLSPYTSENVLVYVDVVYLTDTIRHMYRVVEQGLVKSAGKR
jgi:hypothetical protein